MNIVEMIQALVDDRTVRDRIYGYEFRLNGEVLERKLPDEDGFKQASFPAVNIRERAQKILDGETIVADNGVRICLRDSRIEMRFPRRFDSDTEDYYVKEPFNSLADLWDVVGEME